MTVLDLSGKVTLGQGDETLLAEVTQLLAAEGSRHVLINLDQVPYMDSAGIGALVTCYRRARERNATVKLLNTRKRVYDLLQVVKLDSIFECYSDERQAIESFAR